MSFDLARSAGGNLDLSPCLARVRLPDARRAQKATDLVGAEGDLFICRFLLLRASQWHEEIMIFIASASEAIMRQGMWDCFVASLHCAHALR